MAPRAQKLTGIVKSKDEFVVTPGVMAFVGAVAVVVVIGVLVSAVLGGGGADHGQAGAPAPSSVSVPATVYRPGSAQPTTASTAYRPPTTTTTRPVPPLTTAGPALPYVVADGPPPISKADFASPRSMAALFAETYMSWQFPASLATAKSRVGNMVTPGLARKFPSPPVAVLAPSGMARAGSPRLVSSVGSVQVYSVPVAVSLYAQDGKAFSQPVNEDLQLVMTSVAGKWLVESFSVRQPAA